METILNYINGELIPSTDGELLDNFNPSTGEVYSKIAKSNNKDAEQAIEAASNAFPEWSQTPLVKRISIIRKIANLIKENEAELAEAESRDNGKPISVSSTVDIPRASLNFEFYAEAVSQLHGDSFPMDNHSINYTLNQPLGVVTCISPWNLPLYLLTWKIAPALLMGNTVVAKPSEVTPMTAFLFSKLCIEAGLPKGVLNILHGLGPDVGETISTHPNVKAVSFTGSTATGKIISEMASPLYKKVSLEMGGKNPNIIFDDCDFDKTLKTTIMSSFANQGQICLCGSRVFVQKGIYEKFKETLVQKTKKMVAGDPLDPKTRLGAVVSKLHYEKILGCIETAKEEGGKIIAGGGPAEMAAPFNNGYFIQPTIIEGLDHLCITNQEEIFGPVISIIPFETEEEVIEMANSTKYGLSASIWTTNLSRAHRVSRDLDAGVVWVNTWLQRDLRTPFGGAKSSGVGREGGMHALKFFSEEKNICINFDG